MRDDRLRGLWCDGFIPEDFAVVGQRCRISGRAWMAFGQGRQESWRFILHLEPAASREAIDRAAMLPAEDVTGWLSLDFDTGFMKVDPRGAYADGKPPAA